MRRKTLIFAILIILSGFCFSQIYAQQSALTIKDCIQIALKNNPDLKNADRRIRLAGNGVTMSRANILPTISARFSGSRSYQSQQGPISDVVQVTDSTTGRVTYVQQDIFIDPYYRNFYSSGASLNQTIFDGGRWWNRIKQSNATYRSSEFNYAATKEYVIATVTQRYYDLLKSQKLQEVYEKAVESFREQLKRSESMYEVGAVAQADVFRSKVQLGNQQTLLINQINLVYTNRNNLNITLGWEPNREIQIIEQDVEIEPLNMTLEDVTVIAEQYNPELRGLEESLKSDQYGIKIAKSTFLPNLSFSANYGRSSTGFGRLYDPFDKNFQLSGNFSLSWNIFNGFSDRAQVKNASINYFIAKETLISRKLSVKGEIEQSYRSIKAYDEIEMINGDNLISAQEDVRLNQERYRIGSGTILEVIDSQVNLIRAQSTLITTKYNRLIVLVNLYATSGILEDKIKFLNK